MPLHTITVNGTKSVVEAPSKSAAGAYANKLATVKVELSTAADMAGVDLATVPIILKGGMTQAEADKAAADKAERERKAAETKSAKEAALV